MSNRSQKERNIRSIQKSGGTYHVTIPIEIINKLGWRVRQKVTVKEEQGRLIVRDWKQ